MAHRDFTEGRNTPNRPSLILISLTLALALGVALALSADLRESLASALENLFRAAQSHHVALPVTILIFSATAYLGAPQALLIAAAVLAFGPIDGFSYSWIATLVSGALTYRVGGQPPAHLRRMLRRISANGFLASFVVRFVPGPPFIIVNAALAAAGVRFAPFMAGLALGSIPKTAIIAFAGGSIAHALDGRYGLAALLAGGLILGVATLLVIRTLASSALAGEDEKGEM